MVELINNASSSLLICMCIATGTLGAVQNDRKGAPLTPPAPPPPYLPLNNIMEWELHLRQQTECGQQDGRTWKSASQESSSR